MAIRKVRNPQDGSVYTFVEGADVEYVNPIEHLEQKSANLYYHIHRDSLVMLNMGFPEWAINKAAARQALKDWEDSRREIESETIPDQLWALLKSSSKGEQIKLTRGLQFNGRQLMHFIFKAYSEYGYTFSEYFAEFLPKGFADKHLPSVAEVRDSGVEIVGDTDVTAGQLKQIVQQRKVTVSKVIDSQDKKNFHCFFLTYRSLRREESWKDGQPHYHYISDKFGLTRDEVVKQLKSKDYNLGNLPHLDLIGYDPNRE